MEKEVKNLGMMARNKKLCTEEWTRTDLTRYMENLNWRYGLELGH